MKRTIAMILTSLVLFGTVAIAQAQQAVTSTPPTAISSPHDPLADLTIEQNRQTIKGLRETFATKVETLNQLIAAMPEDEGEALEKARDIVESFIEHDRQILRQIERFHNHLAEIGQNTSSQVQNNSNAENGRNKQHMGQNRRSERNEEKILRRVENVIGSQNRIIGRLERNEEKILRRVENVIGSQNRIIGRLERNEEKILRRVENVIGSQNRIIGRLERRIERIDDLIEELTQ